MDLLAHHMRYIISGRWIRPFFSLLLGLGWLLVAGTGCVAQETTVPTPSFTHQAAANSARFSAPTIPQELRFEHIGLSEGLSQSSVTSIFQDSQGFLWVGTFGGLNRYDGYQFTIFKYRSDDPHSLSGNLVWEMLESQEGSLWVATQGDGVSRLNPDTEQFTPYRHDDGDPHSLAADFVQTMVEDRQGRLWFGTLNGLDRFDPATGRFAHFRNDFDPPDVTYGSNLIEDMVVGSDGTLWLATYNGLLTFDSESEAFARYEVDPQRPQANGVGALFFESDDRLWVSTLGGLYFVNPNTWDVSRYEPEAAMVDAFDLRVAHVIHRDPYGTIWMGTADGLLRWDETNGGFTRYGPDPEDPHSLRQPAVAAINSDAAGIMWVGTINGGLSRFDPWQQRFHYVAAGAGEDAGELASNTILAFYEDHPDSLWVGTGAGLEHWDRREDRWTHYPLGRDDTVYQILPDRDRTLWMVVDEGLIHFSPISGQVLDFVLPETIHVSETASLSAINFAFIDSAGNFWLGTSDGLGLFDRATGQTTQYRYSRGEQPAETVQENMIGVIVEDRYIPGRLWLATRGGLARFEDERFYFYTHDPADPNSLSHNNVNQIYQDSRGILWIGTDAGLDLLNPAAGLFDHYRENDGLPNDVVVNLLPDNQEHLWISTNRGLTRFEPQSETFRNYDTRDGLQGLEFNSGAAYRTSQGELFFGGLNGFNYFDPAELGENPYVPPVVITSLNILNEPVKPGPDSPLSEPINRTEALELSYHDNVLAFELAALHYASPGDNQYAFMMEGFDETWSYLGNRRYATYTNLPPGNYTFRAIGSNSDGVWNETGTEMAIAILPPWWQTPLFRAVVILFLAALAFGGYRLRVRRMRLQSQELAKQVAERTQELAALYTITAFVSSSLDLKQTLTAALDKTMELMAGEAGAIHLVGERAPATLTLASHRGLTQLCCDALQILPAEKSFLGPTIDMGEPRVVFDLKIDPWPASETLADCGFSWLAVTPLTSRGVVMGTLFITGKSERTFSARNLELLSSIGNQAGIAIENARFFTAANLRAEQFELINEVSQRFTSILNIDEVLVQVAQLVRHAFGYYHVGLGLVEGDEVVYRVGAGELWDEPAFEFRPARLKIGSQGLTGWVAASGQPLIVPDVNQDERYVWMRQSATRSELVVPLMVKKLVIGVLDIQSDKLDDFDETDLVVMQSLANQAAIAIENARLYEQAQQLAIMEERGRLARDLHDSVTQSIYSLTLLAEAGQRMIQAGDVAQITQNQSRLGAIAQQALQEMRLLVYELRPSNLKQAGLIAALEQRLEIVERRAGVEARLEVVGDFDLPDVVAEALYRIAHEALNNSLKHAGATAVSVSLRATGHSVLLVVGDNGRGFETTLIARQGGLGLVGMAERAAGIGGKLQISSVPGQGTEIRLEAPLTGVHAKGDGRREEEAIEELGI